jgi:hypothetical protein
MEHRRRHDSVVGSEVSELGGEQFHTQRWNELPARVALPRFYAVIEKGDPDTTAREPRCPFGRDREWGSE